MVGRALHSDVERPLQYQQLSLTTAVIQYSVIIQAISQYRIHCGRPLQYQQLSLTTAVIQYNDKRATELFQTHREATREVLERQKSASETAQGLRQYILCGFGRAVRTNTDGVNKLSALLADTHPERSEAFSSVRTAREKPCSLACAQVSLARRRKQSDTRWHQHVHRLSKICTNANGIGRKSAAHSRLSFDRGNIIKWRYKPK